MNYKNTENGGTMKKAIFCLAAVFVVATLLYAETAIPQQQTEVPSPPVGQQMKCPMMKMHGQGMVQGEQMPMMHGGQQMQGMMQMCPRMCPRMGQMTGHGMVARDMMQMMTDVIKIQQKMIRGLSPIEKKEMMKDTEKMLEKVEKMMSDMRGMMMRGMMEPPAPPTDGQVEQDHVMPERNAPADCKH